MAPDLPPPLDLAPVTRTDFVRYAGASGDFNPIHHDAAFAAAAGLHDVMAQGMFSAGLVATALERWFGPGALTRFAVRFRRPVWPGDVLQVRCDSLVPRADGTADLEVSLVRQDGEIVLGSTATIQPQEGTGT